MTDIQLGTAATETPRCLEAGAGHTCTGPVLYRDALSGTGVSYPRCDGAWAARLELQDRHRRDYPDGPTPPPGFDPCYAGERWDEDD